MDNIRTTIFLPKKQHGFLKKLAAQMDTSIAKLIQYALKKVYIDKEEKDAKKLWGIVENTNISEDEFSKMKNQLHAKK